MHSSGPPESPEHASLGMSSVIPPAQKRDGSLQEYLHLLRTVMRTICKDYELQKDYEEDGSVILVNTTCILQIKFAGRNA